LLGTGHGGLDAVRAHADRQPGDVLGDPSVGRLKDE
jgi:hypothetical protein